MTFGGSQGFDHFILYTLLANSKEGPKVGRRMKLRFLVGFLIVAVIGTLSVACSYSSVTLTEIFEEEYDFQPGGQFSLSNVNGPVIVEDWSEAKVKIWAEKMVKARNRQLAQEVLEETKIEVHRTANRIQVKVHAPRGGFFDWIFGRKANISIRFHIWLPKRADMTIKTVNGRIKATGVQGESFLKTVNGRIRLQDLQGKIDGKVVNGAIECELGEASSLRKIALETVNGSIRLAIPEDLQADVSARTVNGNIDVDFPARIHEKRRFTTKRVEAIINGGGIPIRLETVNGSISIRKR